MPFYALTTIPLIRELSMQNPAKQVWHVDDSAAVGTLSDCRKWLGTQSYMEEFVHSKVTTWTSHIKSLTKIALSHPHATYATFTHGLLSLWQFVCRTTPN